MSKKSSLITRDENQLDWKILTPFLVLFILLTIGFITFVLAIPNNESLNRFKNFEENSNSSNSPSQSSQSYFSSSSSSSSSSSVNFGAEKELDLEEIACPESVDGDVIYTEEGDDNLKGSRGCFFGGPGNDTYFFRPKPEIVGNKQIFMYDNEGTSMVTISTDYELGKIDSTTNTVELKNNGHDTLLTISGKNITVTYGVRQILKL